MQPMPQFLIRRRRVWYAILEIPKSLRPIFGKSRFKQTLETESLSLAENRVRPVIVEWKRIIEFARSGDHTSLEAKVFRWRGLIEEERRAGRNEDEIREISLDVIDTTEESLVHEISFGKKHLLSERIRSYLASMDVEPKTLDAARKSIGRFTKQFKFAHEATKRTVINWVEDDLIRKQGLSATTCRSIISYCRGYWAWLERHHDLELAAPFSGVVPSAKKARKTEIQDRRKHLGKEDIRKLIQAAAAQGDDDLADLITLAAHTGCRIAELCGLKLENVSESTFKIVDAKTEAGWRSIPIHSAIKQLVARLVNTSKDGYLLSGLTFNKYGDRSNAIGKRFGRLKTSLGYGPDHVFHSIRKGVATQLETANVPENVSARILGHDLKTMSYGLYSGGVSEDVLRNAIEELKWG